MYSETRFRRRKSPEAACWPLVVFDAALRAEFQEMLRGRDVQVLLA